jgi:D-serine deaminase-like pyridoxal phosphate-dependent protein
VRVDRRGFLKGGAAVGSSLGAAACGGSGRAPGDCAPVQAGGACTPFLPDGIYFAQLAKDLTAAGIGTPQIVIDLDRLDLNADAIAAGVGPDRYRIVEKSLPSLDLLDHVRSRTGTDRFLVLHLPFLPAILDRFSAAEVLIGKPQPIAAVRQFFGVATNRAGAVARVRFLADTAARAEELAALAGELGHSLQVSVEIDVGLHRGGVRRPSGLSDVLSVFAAHADLLSFTGFLGYDGHVANTPGAPGLEGQAARAVFKTSQATYQSFIDRLTSDFGSLVKRDLIFNSGSSSTYPLYRGGPVNDVAAGGGMLRPASYPNTFIGALRPAVFIAAPVLAHFDEVELPLVNNLSRTFTSDEQGFTIYGGGWAAEFVWPPGVDLAPLVNDPENLNLVPNQSWMVGPSSPPILPGHWIFQHPRVADAIFQFETILLVRAGRLDSSTWRAFPRRY